MSEQRRHGGQHGGRNQRRPLQNKAAINFGGADRKIDPELFNSVAQVAARDVADCSPNTNKSTQLRRFYDEIVMWHEKIMLHPEKFDDYLPYVRMLNAKAAYAEGRKLVDGAWVDLVGHCVSQVNSVETMRSFKLFFEAFMGFYKLEKDAG
jgi:CRISPR-associated protein Csm2